VPRPSAEPAPPPASPCGSASVEAFFQAVPDVAVDLDDLLADSPPAVEEAARGLVRIVEAAAPQARRRIDRRGVRFYLGPPGSRAFVAVWPTGDHVRLLFPQGHRLKDADRWLEGGGRDRSLPVPSLEHVDLERVRTWVKTAAEHADRQGGLRL